MPLLTLGLPTSATAAMMLAGFQQYGLNPGPLLFADHPQLVWGLIASLYLANVMLLVLNLPLVGLWVRLLAIPQPWLYAGILVFATMGNHRRQALHRRADDAHRLRAAGLHHAPVRLSHRPGGGGADSSARWRKRNCAGALHLAGRPHGAPGKPHLRHLLAVAAIALIAPFVLKNLGRFKANED